MYFPEASGWPLEMQNSGFELSLVPYSKAVLIFLHLLNNEDIANVITLTIVTCLPLDYVWHLKEWILLN